MTSKSLAANFARELRAARQVLGLTQAEVSERTGIAVEAYGRLERGGVLPRADTLVRLAVALGVSADSLLGLPSGDLGARRVAAEPQAAYEAPDEARRIARRLRREARQTARLLDSLERSLEPRRGGRPE